MKRLKLVAFPEMVKRTRVDRVAIATLAGSSMHCSKTTRGKGLGFLLAALFLMGPGARPAFAEDEPPATTARTRIAQTLDRRPLVTGALGAIGLHVWCYSAHCRPGHMPLVQLTLEHPVLGCAAYLAAGFVTAAGWNHFRRRR